MFSGSQGGPMTAVMSKPRDNLPADRSTLVGRRVEAAEVKRCLTESRLVTLTGVGGSGKTRLAVSVARSLRRIFSDGVWQVELAELSKPDLLLLTVMRAVGMPVQSHESLADLLSYLRDKQTLIVLDNCEHLIEACANLVDGLLRTCPNVRVIATSREPLRISGERTFWVPPLSLPDSGSAEPGDEARFDAISLFVQRAEAVVPGFTVTDDNRADVAELCRQLDGLPLAIEMAAVRTRSVTVHELLARHRDRYGLLTQGSRAVAHRHQTLRAAMDWSYELCSQDERALWAQLSVFPAWFDLIAVEAVCAVGADPADTLHALTGLVEKSVVTHDGARYRMLETIRQYGALRLAERGDEAVLRARHRDFHLAVARRLEAGWFGAEQIDLLGDLQGRHASVRAALEFCLAEPGEARAGLALAGALWAFWIGTGQQREGQLWLERLLDAEPAPCPERAVALWEKGHLLTVIGLLNEAMAALDECRDLAEDLREPGPFAHATYNRGLAELFRGDTDEAITHLEEGVALESGLPGFNPHRTVAMVNLGMACCYRENVHRAIEILQECRETCADHGEQWMRSWSELFLGVAYWLCDENEEAGRLVRDALISKRNLSDVLGAAVAVDVLAWIAHARGDDLDSAKLLGAGRAMWEPLGAHLAGFTRMQEWSAACSAEVKAELGGEAFDVAVSAGAGMADDAAIALALGERETTPRKRPAQDTDTTLTRREMEVAALVANGLSNKEIANSLIISVRTVEAHVEHILRKLGFTSRAKIAAYIAGRSSA